jgi:hypothetical protein
MVVLVTLAIMAAHALQHSSAACAVLPMLLPVSCFENNHHKLIKPRDAAVAVKQLNTSIPDGACSPAYMLLL